jgi:glycine/serine hydroxymethyltransferase
MARRIMSLPFLTRSNSVRRDRRGLSGSGRKRTCHDAGIDANHNHYETDTKPAVEPSGIQSRFATTAFDINDRTPFRWKGTIKNR